MSSRRRDKEGADLGGFFALVGYTQQMLGSAAQFVRSLAPAPPPDQTDWEVVQSFEVETDGQDAKFVSSRLVLTQYKFSVNPDKYPIGPAALEKIADSFQKSEQNCQELALKPIERILRSNRPLSPTARPDKYGIKYEQYNPLHARREVEAYAKEFGITEPAELADSLSRVISELISIGAGIGSHRITREQFDRFVTGSGSPLSLAIPKALCHMQEELDKYREMYLGHYEELTEREQFMTAISQITDDAIVVITGKGGYGKSTALWQFLREVVHSQPASARLAQLVRSASSAPASFGVLIDTLRGISSARADDTVALRRIMAANPDTEPPILLLGWDGVDQRHLADGWLAASQRVIDFFWHLHQKHKDTGVLPPARLLVSCRRKEEFDLHISTITGHGVVSKRPTYIELDLFSDLELIRLLRAVDGPCAARLSAALNPNPIPAFNSGFVSRLGSDDAPSQASIETLRQPIMWHCFSQLAQPLQLAFLDGDGEARAEMANSYLKWFARRVNQRHGIDEQEVEAALDELARIFPSTGEPFSTAEFFRCLDIVLQSVALARRLYGEAISSGLLDDIPAPGGRRSSAQSSWRWRYGFVVTYLLNRQGRDSNV